MLGVLYYLFKHLLINTRWLNFFIQLSIVKNVSVQIVNIRLRTAVSLAMLQNFVHEIKEITTKNIIMLKRNILLVPSDLYNNENVD